MSKCSTDKSDASKIHAPKVICGYLVDIFDELAQSIGFEYDMHFVRDGRFGALDPETGLWSGMIGEIISQMADIAVSPLTISSSRLEVVDFTVSFFSTNYGIIYLKANTSADPQAAPFTGVNDLLDSELQFGLSSSSSTYSMFSTSKIPTIQRLFWIMDSSPSSLVSSEEEGLRRVRQGDYAYMCPIETCDYVVATQCDMTMIDLHLWHLNYGFALRKGSPLTHHISKGILKLQESGFLETLKKRWWAGPCEK